MTKWIMIADRELCTMMIPDDVAGGCRSRAAQATFLSVKLRFQLSPPGSARARLAELLHHHL